MKRQIFLFLLALCAFPCVAAEPLFTWDLIWTGYWYRSVPRADDGFPQAGDIFPGGTFFNRGDFRLEMPGHDLSFRFMATDKRNLPLEVDDGRAGFNPGMGIYHTSSGSRFLAGVQSEHGLPARVSNIWTRSVPFMESRRPSSRDLKLEPAARDESETYLYMALPPDGPWGRFLPGFTAFASAALDAQQNPAFGAGVGIERGGSIARLEGFYTQKELPARTVSTWFSQAPPLPERDFRLYSLGMIYNSPQMGFAADWAMSETFAWGQGTYGNFSLRQGNRPWRFSLAGDAAGNRFVDRNGSAAGAGLRVAARGERFWPRSGLLRFQSVLRAPAPGEEFERGSFSVFYRPSAPTARERRENPRLVRFSRASVGLSRDARTPERTTDTLNALAGFHVGPFSAVFSCALTSLSAFGREDGIPPLFQPAGFEEFQSLRVSGELGFGAGPFNIRTRLAYTARAEREPVREYSLNTSFRPGRWGRVTLNVAATDFPQKWNYTLSWRYAASH
ncbi:MAG: hypothetical protein FWC64_04625 [Treponema sp.]|nr:hypothetical protein [Treponema sp.]